MQTDRQTGRQTGRQFPILYFQTLSLGYLNFLLSYFRVVTDRQKERERFTYACSSVKAGRNDPKIIKGPRQGQIFYFDFFHTSKITHLRNLNIAAIIKHLGGSAKSRITNDLPILMKGGNNSKNLQDQVC